MKIVINTHGHTIEIPLNEQGFQTLDDKFGFDKFVEARNAEGADFEAILNEFVEYLNSHHMQVSLEPMEEPMNKSEGSGSEFANKIKGPHTLLSVENSPYPDKVKVPHQEGVDHHEETVKMLRQKGEDAHSIQGHYGSPERSIVVFNPKNRNALNKIAHGFGQESIIHSDGNKHQMHFLHGNAAGSVVHGEGSQFHQQKPENYYSTLPDGTHFTHNFNF